MRRLRQCFTFVLLLVLKGICRLLFRYDMHFLGQTPPDPWAGVRLVALLHHTSLYEPVFVGGVPPRFLWRIARHAVVPIAKKTADRPLVGRFFKTLVAHPVSITRQRDHTWEEVLETVDDPEAMLVILPEGRMKRRNGLDSEGRPLTVRGGVADLLLGIPQGRFLLAYSGGLHHIQAPGELLPRLFQPVGMRLENVDLAAYRQELLSGAGEEGFRQAVIDDLTRRRDLYCPLAAPEAAAGPAAPEVSGDRRR